MAYSILGKDTERADYNNLADRFSGPTRNLTSFERETLDRMPHASDALVVPIFALIPLTDFQIERIINEVKDPDYVEGSGMKFKVIKWKGRADAKGKGNAVSIASGATGSSSMVTLSEREMEVEMLKIAKRKRRGLLVFADEMTVAGEGVRVSNYEIWDDGWGDEKEVDGMKGEGLKWGRVGNSDLMRVYTDVEVGTTELENVIVGGKSAAKVIRWGRLEVF